MKIKMSCNACFHRVLLFVVLMGLSPMAHGDRTIRFFSVVTNVPDANHILVDGRRIDASGVEAILNIGPVRLGGIAAPEQGSPEEAVLRAMLEKTLLGKQIRGIEYIGGGDSDSASIYVTDDPRRRPMPEDNVNLMLVREGYARFDGRRNTTGDGALGGMAEAQRLAQEERKGIWATFEATPEPPHPPAVANAPEPESSPPAITPEVEAEPSTAIAGAPANPPAPAVPVEGERPREPPSHLLPYAAPLLILAIAGIFLLRRKK